jgi:predicted cytidylate kinase
VSRRAVTLGGPPGSGKSTAGRRAAEALGLEFRSAGEEFRRQGHARGMDVEAFGRYAESHPDVDRELDRAMLALTTPGRLIEARLAGPLGRQRGIALHYLVVTASEEERARRVGERDHQTLPEALSRIRARAGSERERYRALYGIDLEQERADLTIDSTSLAPSAVADAIVRYVRGREAEDDR